MPKAKLHKEKTGIPTAMDNASYPTANLPATKEIVSTFAIGDEVVVMIKGKIKATSAYENDGSSRADFTVAVEEVEAYSEESNEYDKMAKEDEEDEG